MILHMLTFISYLALTLTTGQAAPIINSSRPRLPVVDLGVTVHRATSNESGGYYVFSNIPYAEPPVGPLRFAQPVPRATVNRTIDDGTNTRICPQANPAWIGISISYVFQVIGARSGQNTSEGNGSIPAPSPYPQLPQSEDCLLLDINVPQTVFKFGVIDESKKLPVLVWIHGGGFAVGSKNDVNPAGLMAAGRRDGRAGFVYVGINYRLLALTWVNKNIHRFGGNPGAVTVIGESAGGSGIKAQLSAFGGVQGSTPFRRGIIQSPAMRPASSAALYAQVYKEFLAAAKLPSISAARALPTTQIQALNAAIIGNAPFGHYPFGPNVDGQFIPDEPAKLLTRGLVDKSVDLIVARNSAEGLLFVDPRVQNETGFEAYFQSLMPTVPRTRISQLATVYPEDFSGAQPYKDQT
ncbi:hypothetical protein NUW58_g488 [Xylaria curta]|uniref:Uncharacterized protein n=1 Tax=Xylaria curta TaxID=42375 RepID=A0ACC1PP77_9PEZI|nr:hypothetical protein NUW58_g488 [Xylaria curta]